MFAHLNLERLVTAIVLIAAFTVAVRVPASPDTWLHLRCGEIQWLTRSVLKADVFSHTAQGTSWVNQSWLPQLAMYGLWAWGGFSALALAVGLVVATTMAFVLATSESKGRFGYLWRAFVILWATISTGRVWAARPHILSFLLTAVWAFLLNRYRAGRKRSIWWLPPLMILWANSHGGYVVGLLMLTAEIGGIVLDSLQTRQIQERLAPLAAPVSGVSVPPRGRGLERIDFPIIQERLAPLAAPVSGVSVPPRGRGLERIDFPIIEQIWRRTRPLLIVMLLSILAALVNPQGVRLVIFPFQTVSSFAQQNYVAEWASPDFHATDMLPFLALLLASWSALVLGSEQIKGSEWLQLLGFTAMTLRSGRYLGLCAVVIAPLLVKYGASALARFVPYVRSNLAPLRPVQGHPLFNWIILALIVVAATIKISQPLDTKIIDQVHRQTFPIAAVDYMRTHDLPATLFNEYAWGGYLLWQLYPDHLVFIDGRADPYGDELITTYRNITLLRPKWQEYLQAYDIHTALIGVNSTLALAMNTDPAWAQVYKDDVAVIFVNQ